MILYVDRVRYMGGKTRIAGRLAPVILDVIRETRAMTYWEPFLGGANMFTRIAPHVQTAIGSDVMPDLIMMWRAVRQGWLPPDSITREEYAVLRHAEPSALRAFAGFGCSFGGKWFGGYGAQKIDTKHPVPHVSYGSAADVRKQATAIRRSRIALLDYREARPRPGWVIYCDPPYAGTTTYTGADAWDADAFWATAQRWSESGCHVLVSEYAAPDSWSVLWEGTTPKSLDRAANTTVTTERLFAWKGSGAAGALRQQHGQGEEEQQPAYACGDGPVTLSCVAAESEGEDGSCPAADRARATACDAGMMPRITT